MWLSPAYQRDVVGLHFTWRSDWRVVEPALALVERTLAPFEPRPRWAKVTGLDPSRIRAGYPRFDDFVALVERYDPRRRFTNPFLDRLLHH